jgi:malonyl-CoA/methylmalonyl-CoA synthetase
MKAGRTGLGSTGHIAEIALPDVLITADHPPRSVAVQGIDGKALTYGDLDVASRRMATQLMGHGVRVGDRVAFQVHKSPMVVVLHLALLRCGAIQVPINPDYAESEVRGFLTDAEPTVVIRDPACPDVGGAWSTFTLDARGQGTLFDLSADERTLPSVQPHDGAAILFTSGTTGRPKGALLTHRNLVHNALVLIDAWGFSPKDHLLHVLPLFHTHGLFVAVHSVLGSGASMTMLPRFDADTALDAIEARHCTVMMGVPTHYARLLANPRLNPGVVSAMRLLVSGSAPMTPALHQAVAQRTGHQVLERYGMTETSMLTSNPLQGLRKAGSVGRPLPGVDVRVVSAEGSTADGVGAVEVRGPNVFEGYWRRPELREEVFTDDGWFRTGDLGRFDSDGYLHLVGRAKDLIISGGLNVYPADVEVVLDAMPGVHESAVVGLPDADLGECVVAVVVAASGRELDGERVRLMARDLLAGYQTPKRVVVVPELPRNAMGKVDKARLRQSMVDEA